MAKNTKKTIEQTADLSRKIWLAGVGAYGRAYTGTKDGIEQASHLSSEMFDELVARGEKIEDDVRSTVTNNERFTQVIDAVGKFGAQRKARFEERVGAVRKGLGLNRGMFNMDEKIDSLSDEVSALRKDIAAIKKAVAKPATKKATAKKVATKTTAKKVAPTADV